MSTPKSVVKINKDGVEYTSSVERCEYTIKELTRAALRDVGKFMCKKFRLGFYEHFHKISGNAGRAVKYKVIASDNTTAPRVQVGLPHTYRGNNTPGFYAYFQEVGSSKQPKIGILRNACEQNVKTIIEIESKYLSALEDEAEALRLIDEDDYEGYEDAEE